MVYPLKLQNGLARQCFEALRKDYLEGKLLQQKNPLIAAEVAEEGQTRKKYFETVRNFQRLVPIQYKRTNAPRLTARGNTSHGMKTTLLLEILKELSLMKSDAFRTDFAVLGRL